MASSLIPVKDLSFQYPHLLLLPAGWHLWDCSYLLYKNRGPAGIIYLSPGLKCLVQLSQILGIDMTKLIIGEMELQEDDCYSSIPVCELRLRDTSVK